MEAAPGSYLVRQSRSEDYRYDLCVRTERGIKNVRIMETDSRDFCITGDQCFPSLMQLIEHYRNHVRQAHTHAPRSVSCLFVLCIVVLL